jgi:uncharacterized delta-60 repeat protein
MKKIILIIFFCFQICVKPALSQSAGSLDSSFNIVGFYQHDFGFNDNPNDVKIQSDQKVVCTGVALSNNYTGVLKVVRLKTDGTPDSTFGTNGIFSFLITYETYGYESYIRNDGKIIVAGLASEIFGYYDMLLLRLNPNGTLDSTFGVNGSKTVSFSPRDDFAHAVDVQSDGKIVVSGTTMDTVNYYNNPCMVRFNENGSLDSSFGTNGIFIYPGIAEDNELTSIAVQSDGKIVAAGHFSNPLIGFNDFDVLLIRLDSTGALDSSFGNNGLVKTSINGGVDDCFGMEIDSSGNIFATGFTTLPVTLTFDMILLKYDSTGTLDGNFGTGGVVTFNNSDEEVGYDLEIQPDHKIVIGGTSGLSFSGPRPAALWRYLPNGSPDPSFGNNGFDTTMITPYFQDINSIALQADGKIVAACKTSSGTQNDFTVIRYFNDLPTSIHPIIFENNLFLSPNPISSGQMLTIIPGINCTSEMRIELFDILGKEVFTYSPGVSISDKNTIQLFIPGTLKSGLYILNLSDGNTRYLKKIVIQ